MLGPADCIWIERVRKVNRIRINCLPSVVSSSSSSGLMTIVLLLVVVLLLMVLMMKERCILLHRYGRQVGSVEMQLIWPDLFACVRLRTVRGTWFGCCLEE